MLVPVWSPEINEEAYLYVRMCETFLRGIACNVYLVYVLVYKTVCIIYIYLYLHVCIINSVKYKHYIIHYSTAKPH